MSDVRAMSAPRIDSAGAYVAGSVAAFREIRRMTQADLAARTAELGRPLLRSSISEIETCGRSVTVDDLVVLARALGLPTADLLGQGIHSGPWRVGQHYRVHVYEVAEGDGPDRVVATFLRPEDATAAVDAYNRARGAS